MGVALLGRIFGKAAIPQKEDDVSPALPLRSIEITREGGRSARRRVAHRMGKDFADRDVVDAMGRRVMMSAVRDALSHMLNNPLDYFDVCIWDSPDGVVRAKIRLKIIKGDGIK